jgi:hypothetical protein
MPPSLEDGFTGGCQCGACRYDVARGPVRQTLCHCRMCQRAVSGPFAALAEVETTRVTWTGTPSVWASSNIAERGFCAACGSPLFYREIGGATIELTAGSLDHPEAYRPSSNHGTERRLAWLASLASLEDRETTLDTDVSLKSYQDARGA